MVICLERVADLHMSQLMPLPLTVFYFSKIQIGFTFLVPAYPGSPGKGPLNWCVCVCVCLSGVIINTFSQSISQTESTAYSSLLRGGGGVGGGRRAAASVLAPEPHADGSRHSRALVERPARLERRRVEMQTYRPAAVTGVLHTVHAHRVYTKSLVVVVIVVVVKKVKVGHTRLPSAGFRS